MSRGVSAETQGGLLDSGATHAVIPYDTKLTNLEQVPVTLAGDARQNWWRTRGGTLVVPPGPEDQEGKPTQTIPRLGALVETLICQVQWSKRTGLRVVHPTLGVLNTGIPAVESLPSSDSHMCASAAVVVPRLNGKGHWHPLCG